MLFERGDVIVLPASHTTSKDCSNGCCDHIEASHWYVDYQNTVKKKAFLIIFQQTDTGAGIFYMTDVGQLFCHRHEIELIVRYSRLVILKKHEQTMVSHF